jgi:hypothetical protein
MTYKTAPGLPEPGVPDGKPLAERTIGLDPMQEHAARAAGQPLGEPLAPPGPAAPRHYVDVPPRPGDSR